jgi:hypothetical protein
VRGCPVPQPFTTNQVLAAKPIIYPLTVPMRAPVTDGAAAALVCTEQVLDRYGFDRSRASSSSMTRRSLSRLSAASIELSPVAAAGDAGGCELGRCLAVPCRTTHEPQPAQCAEPPESCKDPQV